MTDFGNSHLCRAASAALCCATNLLPMLAGCDAAPNLGKTSEAAPKPGVRAETPARPYLENWSPPSATLILSGETHGYMEPCGCSPTQSGGLARRANFLKKLDERRWPYAGLDVGGTLKRFNRQSVIKFESILTGMKQLRYLGLGLGQEELLLGADYLLAQQQETPDAVSLMASNVVFFDSPDLGTPLPAKILTVGGVKIGVTAVLGASLKNKIAPEGVMSHISISDPAAVLPRVVQQLRAENPAFLVLLSHGTVDEAKQLAEKFPEFRIILTAGGPEDASGKPIVVGQTMILETGAKGRSVGVLGYYPQNPANPFRFELVELDSKRFGFDPRMVKLMRDYQHRLETENLVAKIKPLPHPSGWKFVGAESCGECHARSYEKWKETGHARAYETLVHGRKGEEQTWVPRIHDPECLTCHSTGWNPHQFQPFESAFRSLEATPHLKGQQCEDCHGPGSKHVELEHAGAAAAPDEIQKVRKVMHRNIADAEKQVCTQCHDHENSPNFEFKTYWEQIKHPWKD
ncbi:MAG: multiheme c-type cytochrome [Planctomycetaceae bacterium]